MAQWKSTDFNLLLQTYKQSTDAWIAAIRAEENLASADHTMVAMEQWDDAGLEVHDVEAAAKKARDRYKNALRQRNYGF